MNSSSRPADVSTDLLWRRLAELEGVASRQSDLSHGDGGGTSGGMDRVWEKLAEHDKRFERVEAKLDRIDESVSAVKFWVVGTAFASFLGMGALVYSFGSYMSGTMSTALAAIQTVLAARPTETPSSPQQPTIIVVPQPGNPPQQTGNPVPPPQANQPPQ